MIDHVSWQICVDEDAVLVGRDCAAEKTYSEVHIANRRFLYIGCRSRFVDLRQLLAMIAMKQPGSCEGV